jgi:hypothetical protein
MNVDVVDGIAKSLFTYTAKIPRRKKRNAGFVKFSSTSVISIMYYLRFAILSKLLLCITLRKNIPKNIAIALHKCEYTIDMSGVKDMTENTIPIISNIKCDVFIQS